MFPRVLLTLLLTSTAAIAATTPEQHIRAAMEAYAKKDYARSANHFRAAIAAGAEESEVFYNGACAAALAGKKANALQWLTRAVELGGVDPAHMGKDSDLTSLHDDPQWKPLLARAEAVKQQRELRWNSPAIATPYKPQLSEDERVAGLSKFWSEAKFNFVSFDHEPAGFDWDALYVKYLPRVRAAKDTAAYYRVLQTFAAELQDGHTAVMPPKELADVLFARPGLSTLYLEGRVIVRDVFDERLTKLGVERGWEIVTVEGQPVAEYAAANVMPYFSFSTQQDKLARAYERFLLDGPLEKTVKVGFKDARGATHDVAVPRMTFSARQAALPNAAAFEWKMLPGNIAWVQLRGFGDNAPAEAFEKAFPELAKSDAMILDIRDHGGGNGSVGERILGTLTRKPFLSNPWKTRQYIPAYRAWGRGEQFLQKGPEPVPPNGKLLYSKPVVMLTSARTYSAGEDFAVNFDAMKRGKLIGEPTGGSTGQPLIITLPGGGMARICTKRDTYPDGTEFIGVGVIPDVKATPTVEDFRAGRDTVLEAALQTLKKR